MYFCVILKDRENSQDIRIKHRAKHLDFVKSSNHIVMAGPLLNSNDEMICAMQIIKAENEAECLSLIQKDPFYQEGLWGNIDIKKWQWIIGNPDHQTKSSA